MKETTCIQDEPDPKERLSLCPWLLGGKFGVLGMVPAQKRDFCLLGGLGLCKVNELIIYNVTVWGHQYVPFIARAGT